MSILIKGMEMPNSCEECPLCCDEVFGFYKCYRVKGWGDDNSRAHDRPLVEIPTPHGRLIDADELEKCVHEWYDVGEYVFADTIRNADTIIEAEVSE